MNPRHPAWEAASNRGSSPSTPIGDGRRDRLVARCKQIASTPECQSTDYSCDFCALGWTYCATKDRLYDRAVTVDVSNDAQIQNVAKLSASSLNGIDRVGAMSIKVMTDVWQFAPYREATLLVLLAMADWANENGGDIFPKVSTLAAKARLSTRATQAAVRRLEADGTVECVKRASGRPGDANRYRINVQRMKELHGCRNNTGGDGDYHPRTSGRERVKVTTAHIEEPSTNRSRETHPLTPRRGNGSASVALNRKADFEAFIRSGGTRWANAPLRSVETLWLNVEHDIPATATFVSCLQQFCKKAHADEEKRTRKPFKPFRWDRRGS